VHEHPILFVVNATSGVVRKGGNGRYVVTLRGVAPTAAYFQDAPGRRQGRIGVRPMLHGVFRKGRAPRNAAFDSELPGGDRRVVGVELLQGRYDGAARTMRYVVRTLPVGSTVGRVKTSDRVLAATLGRTSVFIDDVGWKSCSVNFFNATPEPFSLQSMTKYSHDTWSRDQPSGTVSPRTADFWESESAYDRGCWNTVVFSNTVGSVTMSVNDPYDSGNTYSCTATGGYVCTEYGNAGGDDMNVGFQVTEVEFDTTLQPAMTNQAEIQLSPGECDDPDGGFNDGAGAYNLVPLCGPSPDSVTIGRAGLAPITLPLPGDGDLDWLDSTADPTMQYTYTLVGHKAGYGDRTQTPSYLPPAEMVSPPTNLTAVQDGANVDLAWSAGQGGVAAVQYRIYRLTSTQTLIGTVDASQLTFTDTSPVAGCAYGVVAVANVDNSPMIVVPAPS
jgi:hypothetical protein